MSNFAYETIERKIDREKYREAIKFNRDYDNSIRVRVPDYNAELAFVISAHAEERISNRCQSNEMEMSRKLRRFFRNCTDDVLLEMVIAAQELTYIGIRTENIAFVFKGYYLKDEGGKRISLIKLITCADEQLLGREFSFTTRNIDEMGIVVTQDTVTYVNSEDPNKE